MVRTINALSAAGLLLGTALDHHAGRPGLDLGIATMPFWLALALSASCAWAALWPPARGHRA